MPLITTYKDDFIIANTFGIEAIESTFENAFENCKDNYRLLTSLVMVLNHQLWYCYHIQNKPYFDLYNKLWAKADEYACDNLTGDELQYFLKVTD